MQDFTQRVVLVGKPGCHLCDDAETIIAKVCQELSISWIRVSILDDPNLADQYFEAIPVTLIDGKVHDQYRVQEKRLRKALTPEDN